MKTFRKVWALNLVLALFLSLFANVNLKLSERFLANAETLDSSAPVADGSVQASVTYGTTTYLGGAFNYLGPYTGNGVPFTVATNTAVSTYPKVNRDVNVVIPDGSGGWYVGGDFTAVGGTSKTNLAHITSAGAVDSSFSPEPNLPVQTLLLDGSTLYVGGAFSSIGGQSYSNLAAVNATTGVATSWNPGADNAVYDIELAGSTLYAVGMFENIGGSFRSKAGAVDTSTALATTWNPYVQGSVYSIELDSTYAYLGGAFWNVASTSVSNLASVALADSTLTSWRPNPNSQVEDLELESTTLYVAGSFSSAGGSTRNALASFETSTGDLNTWDPNVGGSSPYVNDILIDGSTAYVGGKFSTIGSSTRYNVAGISTSSGTATDFDPVAGGTVNALAKNGTGSVVYVAGGFKSSGSGTVKRTGLAAINNSTNSILTFDASVSGGSAAVYSLALSSDGGTLYVGGSYTAIDGVSRESLASVATATGEVNTSFNASIASNSYIYSLLLNDTTLYLGGRFNELNSQSRYNLASVSTSNGSVTSWDPSVESSFSGYVYDMALSGSTLYIGGSFATAGGQSRTNVAAIDTSTGAATSWNPGANGEYFGYVYDLELSGATVYLGGTFTTAGGSLRNNIAAIDTSAGTATSWNPNANGTVQAMSVLGSNVYVGGNFTTIGGESRTRLAALSASTGLATSWSPSASESVYLANATVGNLFVGGDFTTVDSTDRLYLAHYTLPTNSAPSVTISSATQKTDGSGTVDVAAVVSDADSDDTVQLKVEYKAGTDCSTSGNDPTLDETDANTTATYGDPKVENDDGYQVGNTSGYITTSSGSNTVNFDWSSMTDLPSVDSTTYCLRVTPYDGTDAGTVATTTVTIDNVVNVPGSVSLSAASTSQINMSWGANSNPSTTQYYAENTTAGTNSGWSTSLSWSSTSLTCGTTYSFRVKARNTGSIETATVAGSSTATLPCADGGSVSIFSSILSSSSNSASSSDEDDSESVQDEVDEQDVAEESVDEVDEQVEPVSDEATSDDAKNAIAIVTDLVITNVSDNKQRDTFADAKKLEQALSVVKDAVTDTDRVNYDLLIEDEASSDAAEGVEGAVVDGEGVEDGEVVTEADKEANFPAANDEFLAEDLDQVTEALEMLAAPKEDIDFVKLSDAERVVEDKVDEQITLKISELIDKGSEEESFEWQVGDEKVLVDRDTQVYVTLDAKKAERMEKSAKERGENKLIIGPSTTIGDSSVSAVLLAMAGAPLDDPQAGEKYFFGGFNGLKKRGITYPDKPTFTNKLKGKIVGKSVLFWVGAQKKGVKVNLFAIDKVDPKDKKSWKIYDLDEAIVDDGNKAVFNVNLEKDLPIDFKVGKKKLYFVVQDADGKGSVVDVEVDFSKQMDLNGVKLLNNLVSFDGGEVIGDPMGDNPEAIGDPMGDVLPDGIKDPMGINSDALYTTVLLAQANNVKSRDLVKDGLASVKYMNGYALPGSTVVVTWKSLTYSSVVIADASEGYFEVEVPDVLEAGNHEALVYVYNDSENLISNITSLLFGKGRIEG